MLVDKATLEEDNDNCTGDIEPNYDHTVITFGDGDHSRIKCDPVNRATSVCGLNNLPGKKNGAGVTHPVGKSNKKAEGLMVQLSARW